MKHVFNHSAEFLILLFLIITFFMSFVDKVTDWNGNLTFLKSHFSKTWVLPLLPATLIIVVILEALASLFCCIGLYEICFTNSPYYFALAGAIISSIILLIFLIGQRIAKDFEGARNITIYFIIALFAVFLFQ